VAQVGGAMAQIPRLAAPWRGVLVPWRKRVEKNPIYLNLIQKKTEFDGEELFSRGDSEVLRRDFKCGNSFKSYL
jgi:hypothetical protein